jgi:tetratricopeptide (TPR) repeat protein
MNVPRCGADLDDGRVRPLPWFLCLLALMAGAGAARQTPAVTPAPPATVLEAAKKSLRAGDFASAIAQLEPLCREAAAPVEALSLLGALYLNAWRPEDALEILERAITEAEADPLTWFNAARASFALGEEKSGEAYLEESARRAPTSQAALLLAERRAAQGRMAEVASILEVMAEGPTADQIEAQDPELAGRIALQYAAARFATGQLESAAVQLERATRLVPQSQEAWKLRGDVLIESGRLDEARAAFARAHELAEAEHARSAQHQRQADRLLTEALALKEQGKEEAALASLQKAIELSSEQLRLRLLEIQALSGLGRQTEALTRAEQLVAMFPENPEALYMRGQARLAAGELERAEADLRRVLEAPPEQLEAAALNSLVGILLARDAAHPEAEGLLERILELSPDNDGAARALQRLRRDASQP